MTTNSSGLNRRGLSRAVLCQLLIRALGVACGVLVAGGLARGLGHTAFGQFSFVLSLVVMAESVGDLGLLSTAVRHLAVHPEAQNRTVGALMIARSITGTLGACAVVVVVFALDSSTDGRIVGLLVGATMLLGPVTVFQAVGQAKLRVPAQNIQFLFQNISWTAAVLILAAVRSTIVVFGAAFLVVSTAQAALTWALFRKLTSVSLRGALRELIQISRIAAPIAVGGLFVTSYYRLGGIILFHYQGASAVADYAAAYQFIDILQVVPGTLLVVVLPLLAATWRSPTSELVRQRDRLFGLALTAVMTAALPLAVGGALISGRLVYLVYGAGFDRAASLLSVLLLAFPAICLGYVTVGITLASGRTILYCLVSAVAAGISVPVNLLLIPVYGPTAATWTTVGTEYAVAAALLVATCRHAGVGLPLRALGGALAATGLMAVAVFPLRHSPVILSVTAGALVYLLGALLFRAVTLADLRSLLDRDRKLWI
jgi:O-antigen/teichoic acid export membrane protein